MGFLVSLQQAVVGSVAHIATLVGSYFRFQLMLRIQRKHQDWEKRQREQIQQKVRALGLSDIVLPIQIDLMTKFASWLWRIFIGQQETGTRSTSRRGGNCCTSISIQATGGVNESNETPAFVFEFGRCRKGRDSPRATRSGRDCKTRRLLCKVKDKCSTLHRSDKNVVKRTAETFRDRKLNG